MSGQNTFPFREEIFNFPAQQFKEHILKAGNERILFSGQFGIGKSLFLDHFFKEESQTKLLEGAKYRAFHIYPVNYSIASNEDIFRYIKYDIIMLMLAKQIQVQENDLTYLETLPAYLKSNILNVVATIISMVPKIGKDTVENYKKLEGLKDEFLKFHKEQVNAEGDKLIGYLEKIENTQGSIFENDIVTKLVSTILNRLKAESKQENVLIIDDLDRIDPEHIFRLLNVFAAHLDNSNGLPNKLGFDKVIIVCDINNIRNIFRAKYGGYTDFNGYIDKFYSSDIFAFDNRAALWNLVKEVFKKVTFKDVHPYEADNYKNSLLRNLALPLDLLQILIAYGQISLRLLIKRMINTVELSSQRVIRFDDTNNVYQLEQPLLTQFKILKDIVGDYDTLKDLINRIPQKGFNLNNLNVYSNTLLFFINYQKTFRDAGSIRITYNERPHNLQIQGVDIKEKLQNLKLNDLTLGAGQHNYTIKEFLTLLNDFIDLLRRVEN